MAIMSKGPGKRTKAAPKKATVKSTVSMIKNMFSTGGKNLGKAKGPGAAAGVASRAGGVNTLTSAKVTGSKQKGIEGLKAKKKSGEMSRAEANAKIKALKGKAPVGKNVTVTGKKQPVKPTYGKEQSFAGGRGKASTYYPSAKSIPSDSAKFMQQMSATNPAAAKQFSSFMKKQQAENPGARFEFGPRGGISVPVTSTRTGETGYRTAAKKGDKTAWASVYIPRVRTVLPNKKKK